LQETIIKMAQNFVGSNNMNLLEPIGQFGSRVMNGQDASSPRYIYTKLSDYAHQLFNPIDIDTNFIEQLEEDGQKIEPQYYTPILPILLINGAEGIGTGFSTKIPSFNPADIKERLLMLLNDPDATVPEMTPWYRGFKGHISKVETNKWLSYGKYEIIGNIVRITELPIGENIENYKQFLEKLESEDRIVNFVNNSTDSSIYFDVKVKPETLNQWEYAGTLEKILKLTSNINATNMHIFDTRNQLIKVDTPEDILYSFYISRFNFVTARKIHLTDKFEKELKVINSKITFIESIISETLIVFKRKKNDIIVDLKKMKLYENPNYDYLLEMPIHTFTEEKLEKLKSDQKKKQEEYNLLQKTTVSDMIRKDLEMF
jgi:DNA topoisomerase-2